MKSNKQSPIDKLCQILHPNSYLAAVNTCCKQLHVVAVWVRGPTFHKRCSQQPEALLKDELLSLGFTKSFKEFEKAIKRSHI